MSPSIVKRVWRLLYCNIVQKNETTVCFSIFWFTFWSWPLQTELYIWIRHHIYFTIHNNVKACFKMQSSKGFRHKHCIAYYRKRQNGAINGQCLHLALVYVSDHETNDAKYRFTLAQARFCHFRRWSKQLRSGLNCNFGKIIIYSFQRGDEVEKVG